MTTPTTPAADAASQRFCKKPVVITAVQFTQAVRDAYLFDGGVLPAGVQIYSTNTHPGRREVYRADAYIKTLEGEMSVTLDDWIITGVNGEHYACKPDIFAKAYEPAELATARESALVAERDALRAALQAVHGELKMAWALHALPANVISAKTAQACAAALAAPAVEGV